MGQADIMGDVVDVGTDGIGVLRNPVRKGDWAGAIDSLSWKANLAAEG